MTVPQGTDHNRTITTQIRKAHLDTGTASKLCILRRRGRLDYVNELGLIYAKGSTIWSAIIFQKKQIKLCKSNNSKIDDL